MKRLGPYRRQPVPFHQDKAGAPCAPKVERHWSMPRTGNSSALNTLSAQFIYCCVSNGPVHCEAGWKSGTKNSQYSGPNTGHKEGASLFKQAFKSSTFMVCTQGHTLFGGGGTADTLDKTHMHRHTPTHPFLASHPPLPKVVFILSVCKTVRSLAASVSFKSASMDL